MVHLEIRENKVFVVTMVHQAQMVTPALLVAEVVKARREIQVTTEKKDLLAHLESMAHRVK